MAKANPLQLKRDAEAAEKKNDFAKAIELWKQFVQENPRDWNTVHRIGDLYAKLNDPKAANEQYVKVARNFAEDGFYPKAIAVWKKVLRNDPSDLQASLSLGDLYAKLGLAAEAKQIFSIIVDAYARRNQTREAEEVRNRITQLDISDAKCRPRRVPSDREWVDLRDFTPDPAVLRILPPETARIHHVFPVSRTGATLTIAMADPANVFAMDDIKFMTGCNVEPVVASESALEEAIDRCYGSNRPLELRREGTGGAPAGGGYGIPGGAAAGSIKEVLEGPTLSVDDMAAIGGLSEIDLDSMADVETVKTDDDEIDLGNLAKSADAAPVIKLVNVMLVDSLKRGASDIHIEPYEREFRIRFRIDGVLYNVMALPMKVRDPLISRIKVMAKLKSGAFFQEGRIKIKMKVEDRSRDLTFLVRCLPTVWGEKIVMRLLDPSRLLLDMTKLGMEPQSLERFKNGISKPCGIVLVTGPPRSGKTNTLYSAIANLNKSDTNIMTVEDPVEFTLPGINQVQVSDTGASFAAVLRSFHRLDPNIIAVSHIGDAETAEVMFKLALNGYLLLSTLDTNDAPSAVSRLVNMGIDPYPVAVAVNLIQAQRLVRRVCSECKVDVSAEVPSKALIDVGFIPGEIGSFQLVKGQGCTACNGTGYKGRVGLHEVMEFTEGIRELIMVGATSNEIKRKALEEGMLTLRMSGLEKIKHGVTTVEEVLRETVL